MPKDVITRILKIYGVSYKQVLPTASGYRNISVPVLLKNGQMLNLMIYKAEPGITATISNANRIGDFLAANNLPTRQTHDPRILRLSDRLHERFACLYNYLPGTTIPWEAYTQAHLKLLGKTMSDMHACLRRYRRDLSAFPHAADMALSNLKKMEAYFANEGVQTAALRKLGLIVDSLPFDRLSRLIQASRRLPGQLLHMDFVRGNILFAQSFQPTDEPQLTISGIIDFEKTAVGHPLFDASRTLAFLLVDCKFKTADKVRKYFLISGYQKRGSHGLQDVSISDQGRQSSFLEVLTQYFLIYDFYKFLRHNPYESLVDNEHYQRTREILVASNILEPAPISSLSKSVKI